MKQQQHQRRSLLTQVFLKVFGVILRFTLEALNMFGPCDKLINMNKRMSVSVSVSASVSESVSVSASENRENQLCMKLEGNHHSYIHGHKKRKEKKRKGTVQRYFNLRYTINY